jgi:hypothetical protein
MGADVLLLLDQLHLQPRQLRFVEPVLDLGERRLSLLDGQR